MSTVWFVTRSYPPMPGGGPFTRQMQVSALRKHFRVVVVTRKIPGLLPAGESDVVRLPSDSLPPRIAINLEKLGLRRDHLIQWAKSVEKYIVEHAQAGDVVFTTSGGEITCIEIGARVVRRRPDIAHVANYHDLLDYAIYDGDRVYDSFHVAIDKRELLALSTVAWFFANSNIMREMIIRKFPFLENRSSTLYFGYVNDTTITTVPRYLNDPISIGYAGAMGVFQRPEVIIYAWQLLPSQIREKLQILFIGDYSANPVIASISDRHIKRIPYIPREEMIRIFSSDVDLAFLSMINKSALRPLMSTKFYEYIGLETPVIAAVPKDCEAARVINEKGYGLVSIHGDIVGLSKILKRIVESPELISTFRDNLRQTKLQFAASATLDVMIPVIRTLLNKQHGSE